ncbi:hypothetical protein SLEP1_g15187 [Rubroshorea leprosula]|uniref:C2 domain-containing protein n=1 Tax=Rubroshorea leprosula TaxID=152421 RepID=A0AAV5ILJ9_9ROSI|nr:hypothetical protein SLEP1_g15187 [Rubroshorea leprosula]
MEWGSLELTLISCRGLRAFNFFQKLSVYSVVYIVDEEQNRKEQQQKRLQCQKTPIARREGGNPEWNHLFHFDLRSLSHDHRDNLFLRFDLRCEGLVNRTIGGVRVPMKDLIDEFDKALRFVSYQVRSCDGKANGVLNFSYKLVGSTKKVVKNHTGFQFLAEKVHYPKLEDDDEYSGSIKYPSLDDFYSPAPQQSYFPSPVPALECQRHGFYRPSLADVPPPYWVAHGAYSASILQPHGPYYSGPHGH